ncbi:MAG TPA: hypothetical protein VG247_19445 [Pseudonocardiaceae bacterium]|jgi:hypothetical protein|nr:hypothetical protein [Pseudonocardiaceae bacterium]
MSRPTDSARAEAALTATVNCYRFQCGLPVSRYQEDKLIMVTGHSVDVIGMPAGLGEAVLRGLRVANLAGPVLAHGTDWWFLCGPVGDSRPELRASLTDHGVHIISRGEAVTVPAELDRRAGWVLSPLPRCTLPPWQAILATARRNLPATEWPYSAAA